MGVITLLLKPLFAILTGWVVGYGVAWVAGSFVAEALSIILQTSITASMLPSVFTGITLLASYIRPVQRKPSAVEFYTVFEKFKNDLKKELRNLK